MLIINDFNADTSECKPSVIALGTFDGIHLGHCDVIKAARKYARTNQLRLVVFTFSNHPFSKLNPTHVPPQLISNAEKTLIFEQLGVDVLVNIPFTDLFLKLSPLQFLQKLKTFSYQCLVVGENYNYGFMGKGDTTTLVETGRREGFDVLVRKLVTVDQQIVSSTLIRNLIQSGEMLAANKMLGREYSLEGIVEQGAHRGKTLGFPTANIAISEEHLIVPATAVYAVKVELDGTTYYGMANIGENPTFGDIAQKRLEVHLFDFDGDVYGQQIKVKFVAYMRGQCKFNSPVELQAQLVRDKKTISNYFAGNEK
ncbi:MAG: bifunctional riboflavin kinase/FAD synthetase [Acidaminococcaceae bacterium]